MNFVDLCSQGLLANSESDDSQLRNTPERRLFSAILMRAITDLLCDSDPKYQKEAREWFLRPISQSAEKIDCSFQQICLFLDIDVHSAQKAIITIEREAKNKSDLGL